MINKILLTGFGDWAGSQANPAKGVADALDGEVMKDTTIQSLIVPSIFEEMVPCVAEAIEQEQPSTVVMMGEYNGRTMITVERIAQNIIDATRYGFGDLAGAMPQDEPIANDGPYAYRSTLPIRAMVLAMRQAGVPADISDTAATFGCNLLMYGVLHHIAKNKLPIRAGWVHLPSLPETAALDENIGLPSMALETQVRGVRTALEATITHISDVEQTVPSRFQI